MTTFGIIGSSQAALELCQDLQQLGFWVNSLTRHTTSRLHQIANSQYHARDINAIFNFATDSDHVFIMDRELQTQVLTELNSLTHFVQNLELYHLLTHEETTKEQLTAFSDPITTGKKLTHRLSLACLGTADDCHLLAITQNHYQKGQLKETLSQPPLPQDLEQSLVDKARAIWQKWQLEEVFFLTVMIFDDTAILIDQIHQGSLKAFLPTQLAWQQSLTQLMIKQVLDYPMPLHLKPEPSYYATWLTSEEKQTLIKQLPYFPELLLSQPYSEEDSFLVLTEPHLTQKLQQVKKIMG